jgi:hypothetical protein
MPGIGIPYHHDAQRVFLKDFAHSIVDREMADSVVVLAVAPFRRKPGYWLERE